MTGRAMAGTAYPDESEAAGATTLFSFSGAPEALPAHRLTAVHREVLAAWNARRAGRPAPLRAALDPADFPRCLANVLLWECTADGGYRCRLSGGEVDAAFGGSLRGVALAELACPELGEARREFDAVRDRCAASYAERTLGWLGKPHLSYRHLLLPLQDEAGRVHRLLGVLTLAPAPFATRRRHAAPAGRGLSA